MRIAYLRLFILWGMLAGSLAVQAQFIEGILIDKDRQRPIRQATVSVVHSAISTQTDEAGTFRLEDLPPGSYVIVVEHPGYRLHTQRVRLMYDEPTQLRICLLQRLLDVHLPASPPPSSHVPQAPLSLARARMNQRQIRQQAARTTPELLQQLPGAWMQQHALGWGTPVVRGLSGDRNLVLLDGIRLNSPLMGPTSSSYLATVDPGWLDRVLLERGSESARHGNSAMGGSLQLFTPDPTFTSQGMQVHGRWRGNYLSQQMEWGQRADLSLSTPTVSVQAGLSYHDFGDLATAQAQRVQAPNAYQFAGGQFKGAIRLGARHRLTVSFQQTLLHHLDHYDRLAHEGFERYRSSPLARRLSYARWEFYTDNPWAKKIQVTAARHEFSEVRTTQKFDEAHSLRTSEDLLAHSASVEVHAQPVPQWDMVSGLAYSHDQVQQDLDRLLPGQAEESLDPAIPAGTSLDNLSLYSLHTLTILKLQLSFGGRAHMYALSSPSHPLFGETAFTPKAFSSHLSARYPLSRHFDMVASFNSGYRMPNFHEMAQWGNSLPNQPSIIAPNKLLGAEKSLSTEVGIRASGPGYSGSVVVYHSRLNDLIEQLPGMYRGQTTYQGLPVYLQANLGQAFVQGVEARLAIPLMNRLLVYGDINYTYGNELNKDRPLSLIPPLHGKAGLRYQDRKGFWGKAEWFYAAEQGRLSARDIANPRIAETGTPPWQLVNVLVGYDLGYDFGWFSTSLGVLNLFNESYRLHGSAINGYGRSFRASIELSF